MEYADVTKEEWEKEQPILAATFPMKHPCDHHKQAECSHCKTGKGACGCHTTNPHAAIEIVLVEDGEPEPRMSKGDQETFNRLFGED